MAKMMRLLHLDAGRKFFGVPALKKIIDSMARAGLTHFQLYFSDNQGFRFGLDDLHFTTEFGEYDLASCLGDGYWEGPKRSSGCGGWLNTADMEQILAYAREKGIEIVPLLNMPGHMGCKKVTIKNLEVVRVDADKNLLLVKGAVPGPKKALITIKETTKVEA